VFLPRICIERPVLATVMSIALIVLGAVGYSRLPVRELPDIEIPIVSVSTVLPGASPEVVETEITEIIEEELNGLEGLDLLQSVSREEVSSITLQFDLDRDIDAAAQDVRDRVARVIGRLPEEAEEPRVAKYDVNQSPIMWLALHSDTRTPFEMMDLADRQLRPRLETVPGVSRVRTGGSNSQAIRIELDRELLAAYGLTVGEVVDALRRQNVEVPGGRVEGTWREFVVKTDGEFATPEQFRRLIVRYSGDSPVRIGDLGTVRYGFENERTMANFNGRRTTGLGIVKQKDANTLAVARGVKEMIPELEKQMPEGFQLRVAFDQSPFIEQSVSEVRDALLIAGVLVMVVIFVFLQSVRTTLIPSVVMPVAIIATFGAIYFLGFTINNLVLMALTLVVGVVVDDAIIVLENCYRHIELGSERRKAALEATSEIAFAVISTTLTLIAVFVPIAFLGGTVGRFFYEFGISVVVAVSVSSFVALTLTPMLCSRYLSVGTTAHQNHIFGRMARGFDGAISVLSEAYTRALVWALEHRAIMLAVVGGAVVASVALFDSAGKEFLPQDDRGYFNVSIRTPEGSTLAYQIKQQRRVEQLLDATPEVVSYFSVAAFTRGGPGKVNEGVMFVRLLPMPDRARHVSKILADLRRESLLIPGADVFFHQFNPLNSSGGSKPVGFVVQNPDFDSLAKYSRRLHDAVGSEIEGLTDVNIDLEINKPELDVTIDRAKAASLGISVADVAETLKVLLGGDAVTYYKRGNERHDVIVQLEPNDRYRPRDAGDIAIRTSDGRVVPLSNIVEVRESVGPSAINHYQRKRSVILEAGLQDLDLGTALERIGAIADSTLPEGFTTALAGQSREHSRSSQGLAFTFLLAILSIYLVLAAQFESFVHPLTIMLALPLATLGALAGLNLFGMNLSVYAYIGMIMLMGLATKNSILLVDYTNQMRERGVGTREAILEAGRTRLRPILMTAVSTIFGILPIAIGLGAGAEGRRPLGVAVVAGMTTSTLLTLLIVPVVYSMIDDLLAKLRERRKAQRRRRGSDAIDATVDLAEHSPQSPR
jgi:multidrug efflux pump